MDGGLDGGRRDAGRDSEDEGEDEETSDEVEPEDDTEDEGDSEGDGGLRDDDEDGSRMELIVPDLIDDRVLPAEFRCTEGSSGGMSPEISWTPGPPGTRSYAVTLRATDSTPAANWTIFDIPAEITTLPPNIPEGAELEEPVPARQALSQSRPVSLGYFGPCGLEKEYELTVYALKVEALPGLDPEPTYMDVDRALAEHSLNSTAKPITSAP